LPEGRAETLSLADLFGRSSEIADLEATPPQRVALMRMLICIVQAALDGPEDVDAWRACRNLIVPKSLAYLDRRKEKFELRGRTPFLQIPGLTVEPGKSKILDMLDCRLSSGNNATLFDQDASPEGRFFDDSEIVLHLITFLNFSTGGKVGQARWNQIQYSESTFAAPCIKSAHTFVMGDILLDTLFFNLLPKEGDYGINTFPNGEWGKPVWEQFPESVDDGSAFHNAGRTYLGRLVPLSRFIKLEDHGSCIIGPTHKGFKMEQLPTFREPSTTVKSNAKTGHLFYLPLSSEKHMWRELGAVLSFKSAEESEGGAPALRNLMEAALDLEIDQVEIWVGGLETGAQAAKLSDMLEWRFRLPLALLDTSRLEQYKTGVSLAEKGEWVLAESVKACFKDLGMDPKTIPVSKAKTQFWSHLDRQYHILFETAEDDNTALSDGWYREVRRAMGRAYTHVCPHETPRQIQAHAKGLERLRLKKPD
jgi:CRISPR system Cascade subunit CasA